MITQIMAYWHLSLGCALVLPLGITATIIIFLYETFMMGTLWFDESVLKGSLCR